LQRAKTKFAAWMRSTGLRSVRNSVHNRNLTSLFQSTVGLRTGKSRDSAARNWTT
jgi:hypothetical protein